MKLSLTLTSLVGKVERVEGEVKKDEKKDEKRDEKKLDKKEEKKEISKEKVREKVAVRRTDFFQSQTCSKEYCLQVAPSRATPIPSKPLALKPVLPPRPCVLCKRMDPKPQLSQCYNCGLSVHSRKSSNLNHLININLSFSFLFSLLRYSREFSSRLVV